MLDPKGIPVKISLDCRSAATGLTPEELAKLMADGWIYLDVLSIRREITTQEKLNPNLKIPPTMTHVAEPMMVFYKVSPGIPPPRDPTGVN